MSTETQRCLSQTSSSDTTNSQRRLVTLTPGQESDAPQILITLYTTFHVVNSDLGWKAVLDPRYESFPGCEEVIEEDSNLRASVVKCAKNRDFTALSNHHMALYFSTYIPLITLHSYYSSSTGTR